MTRRGLLAWVLVLSLAGVVAQGATASYRNRTGRTVYGLRVLFRSSVEITEYDNAFSTVEPTGRRKEFIFSGGSLEYLSAFSFSWTPESGEIRRHEWLTAPPVEVDPACSVTYGPSYFDMQRVYEGIWDGIMICLEPGTYDLAAGGYYREWAHASGPAVTIRGLGESPEDVVLRGAQYAQIFSSGEMVLTLENLTLDEYAIVTVSGSAHATLRNVTMRSVRVLERGTLEIIDSTILRPPGFATGLSLGGSTTTTIVGTTFEVKLAASGNAMVTLTECSFVGPWTGITVQQTADLAFYNCSMDSAGTGIRLGDFTGTISGSGNRIEPDELRPGIDDDVWPIGFLVP